MFLEDEDWSDDRGAAAVTITQSSSPSVKTKAVGKKSLLRTLQTLGSVPQWKSEEREENSDSDAEPPNTDQGKKKRRKKKRQRKRKHEDTEEQVNTELSQEDAQESPKRRKKDKLEKIVDSKTTDAATEQETAKPEKGSAEDSEKKLSRKQWKNRMKNKRKCKNKFRSIEETPDEKDKKKMDNNSNLTNQDEEEVEINCKKDILKLSEGVKNPAEDKVNEMKKIREDPATLQKSKLNKELCLKKEKLRKLLESQKTQASGMEEPAEAHSVEKVGVKASTPADTPNASLSLRARMEQRLESARFRFINETLYSCNSREARRMFSQDPEAFWVYHRGYSAQVQRWPSNPVDNIIRFIQSKSSSLVVADFGCGDCKIAKSVKNKVHSFDLVATCELVKACDMASVPLKDGSVDIAVFCLSLMGTNLVDFLKEANRVLKKGGFLKIAEVSSRFDNVRGFICALAALGFKLQSKDTENTHFYSFDFVKTKAASENVKKTGLQLKPCVYKKR